MAYDSALLLHHQVQLRDEVGVAAVLVEDVMLGAPGAVDVPECLAGEVLHFAEILGLFGSDIHVSIYICSTFFENAKIHKFHDINTGCSFKCHFLWQKIQ
jgi:hypothetical protein